MLELQLRDRRATIRKSTGIPTQSLAHRRQQIPSKDDDGTNESDSFIDSSFSYQLNYSKAISRTHHIEATLSSKILD